MFRFPICWLGKLRLSFFCTETDFPGFAPNMLLHFPIYNRVYKDRASWILCDLIWLVNVFWTTWERQVGISTISSFVATLSSRLLVDAFCKLRIATFILTTFGGTSKTISWRAAAVLSVGGAVCESQKWEVVHFLSPASHVNWRCWMLLQINFCMYESKSTKVCARSFWKKWNNELLLDMDRRPTKP